MKRTAYISTIVMTAFVLGGCGTEIDLNTVDQIYTARLVFSDVDEVVHQTVELTARALVLSTYIDAETEDERYKIEDTYYIYNKVRGDESGNWQVKGYDYSEEYYLSNNVSLAKDGASWLIKRCTPVFETNKFNNSELILRRTGSGSYKLFLNKAKIGDVSSSYYWGEKTTANSRYTVDGELNITTDFFSSSGQDVSYTSFSVDGTLTMTDSSNSNFTLSVSIPKQLDVQVRLPNFGPTVASGTMTIAIEEKISKTNEAVRGEYLSKGRQVALKYSTADGTYSNTYPYNYF